MSSINRVTDKTFEKEVLSIETPVLVEFWASWCPPCKMVEIVLEELALEYDGKIHFCNLNVDQNPSVAGSHLVTGVPTFIIFVNGDEVKRKIGAQSKGQLRGMIEEVL